MFTATPRTRHLVQTLPYSFLLLTLSACVSAPPLITAREVDLAIHSSNPESTYDVLKQRIQNTPHLQAKRLTEAQAELNRLGHFLMEQQAQLVLNGVKNYQDTDHLIPLPVLNAAVQQAQNLRTLDTPGEQALESHLLSLRTQTENKIQDLAQQRTGLDETDFADRYQILSRLIHLSGDPRYERERSDLIDTTQKSAQNAMQSQNFSLAAQLFGQLQRINPDDSGLTRAFNQAQAQAIVKSFWDAINQHQPKDAYTHLIQALQSPTATSWMNLLGKSGKDIPAFYLAKANNDAQQGHWSSAYRNFHEARQLRQLLHPKYAAILPEEKPFATHLNDQEQAFEHSGNDAKALGLLLALQEFHYPDPSINHRIHDIKQRLIQRALPHISTIPFSGDQGDNNFGVAIAAQLSHRLFQLLPHDAHLIDNSQLQVLLKNTAPSTHPHAADYLIEGNVLAAHIDTTEEKGTKTMRVNTDLLTTPNPLHSQWLALSHTQRLKTPEPSATVSSYKQQDITSAINQIRKIGLLSASFRMVEAQTSQVLYTATKTVQENDTDQGNEGIDIGIFHLPFKLPNLPSDSEIYNHLTQQLADAIVDDLNTQLKDTDIRYEQSAEHACEYNDYDLASRYAAFAYSIADTKHKDTTTVQQQLLSYVFRSLNTTTNTTSTAPTAPTAAIP